MIVGVAVSTSSPSVDSQTLDTFEATLMSRVAYSITPQPSGKILLGGGFTNLDGQPRGLLGRVNADGTLDSFNPGASPTFVSMQVACFALQTDGKIIIGGSFFTLAGQSHSLIGRVDDQGLPDGVFSFSGVWSLGIAAFAIQQDGKILTAGGFSFNAL